MIVAGQIEFLGTYADKLRPLGQVHAQGTCFRLRQLPQAKLDTIEVTTTVFQSLAHHLRDAVGRVILVELQDANELPHPAAIGPLLPQMGQQSFVDRGPALPPATDWLGVVERTGSLFQQR